MSQNSNLEQIILLAETIAKPQGFALVDARFSQQGAKRTLEITIHRPGGQVSLSDCELMSRELEPLLDQQDPPLISGAFMLEVQSPGIDRQLKTSRELAVFSGHAVEIQAKEDIAGLGMCLRGILLAEKDGALTIGQPQVLETQTNSKSRKKSITPAATAAPPTLQIDKDKLIHIRLHPGEPSPKEKHSS